MPSGFTIIDFGSIIPANKWTKIGPNAGDVRITISGQGGILMTSFVEAWIFDDGSGSVDHSADEHFIENIRVQAGNIVVGVGFDIVAECTLGGTYGQFNVAWVWI